MEYRSQPLGKSSHFASRAHASVIAVGVVLGVLALRTAYLTVVQGEDYRQQARANLVRNTRIDAPRGNIYDRNNLPLATNRRAYSITYSRYRRSETEINETLRRLSELLDEDYLARKDEIMETRPAWTRHSLARRLSLADVVPIMERPDDFPGVRLHDDSVREYPLGPALAHITGFTGRITAEDVHLYQRPLYLPDDYVGRAGIERQYEAQLVGKPGRIRATRDARGALLDEPLISEEAAAGDDLVLAIDSAMQRAAIEGLGERTGSVVVMDLTNGDLLVLASTPVYDPARPGRQEIDGRPISQLHRAYRGTYAPASTFKLVSAAAILREGYTPDHRVHCDGSWQWPGWLRPFHCNVRSGHGALDLSSALKVSCNVYMYELAHAIGGDALMEEARAFGYASPTGIDMPGERAGQLHRAGSPPSGGELLNVSIGQGAILATPLQVATSFAVLASRDGLVPKPRVVSAFHPAGTDTRIEQETEFRETRPLLQRHREALLEGMWRAANEPGGTAYGGGTFPRSWEICGKTGTAENGRGGVDAWFATVFPRSNPRYVAVAHIEDADAGGGEAAVPLLRPIIGMLHGETPDEVEATTVAEAR